MSEITQQIKDLLSNEALSHSLSKEALERMLSEIKSLTTKVENLTGDLEFAEVKRAEAHQKMSNSRDANDKLSAELNGFKKRVAELDAREKLCAITEIRNEFEKQRGDEFCALTNKIFENRIVRESVTSTYPVRETYEQESGNGIQGYKNET